MNRQALLGLLAFTAISSSMEATYAQGPSSRPVFSGPTFYERNVYGETQATASVIPIPDLFRTEAPFVERNARFDYLATNRLHEPPADESQFFTEVSYSFTDQFGVIFAAPLLIRDNLVGDDTSGFGDLEAGVRYVFFGAENEAPTKMAFGLNVLTPTGDSDRELGEGLSILEPQFLYFRRVAEQAFFQSQFSVGVPLTRHDESTEFGWNLGLGYVFVDYAYSDYLKFPTAVIEFNGQSLLGGADAGRSALDITPGLRWSVGSRAYAGIALSVPVMRDREFETQFILSFIYRYGPVDQEGVDSTSSRAFF